MSIEPGERLREEIDRLGVSALSRRLGVARNTLYNWAEKQNIPLEQLFEIGEAGADLSYILTGQRGELTVTLNRVKVSTALATLLGGSQDEMLKNQQRIFELLSADEMRAADERSLLADYRLCERGDQEVIRKMARSLAKVSEQ